MNDTWIVTVFVITDDLMHYLEHYSHVLAQVPDPEIVTVAVVAAKYFQNNHERALYVLQQLGFLSGTISVSRFNRRLHALADWLMFIPTTLGEIFADGEVFMIDSIPALVCRRVRARRCCKVRGRVFCGYCAAKKEKFFGWRLHLVCTPEGIPVNFAMLPASFHDLTPVHELTANLSPDSRVFGDKAFNSAPDEATLFNDLGVKLIPVRKVNMKPHTWLDEIDCRDYRHTIENVNSQLESMGIQQLHARTNAGFEMKVHASLIAVTCTNLN